MTDTRKTIVFAADHGGVGLKDRLKQLLAGEGYNVIDVGTSGSASCDYPDFAHLAAAEIEEGRADWGVLVCGSGIGMSIAANRHAGIRCALLHDVTGARLTRAHNNANVVALGARTTGEEVAIDIVNTFLATAYEGGRHDRRLDKLQTAQ